MKRKHSLVLKTGIVLVVAVSAIAIAWIALSNQANKKNHDPVQIGVNQPSNKPSRTTQLIASKPNSSSTGASRAVNSNLQPTSNHYKVKEIVSTYETPLNKNERSLQTIERKKILKTDFKYPLIRVVDTVVKNPMTGAETIKGHSEVVADQMIVKLLPGQTIDDLQRLNSAYGANIVKPLGDSGAYLVGFHADDANSLDKKLDQFNKASHTIAFAEPNHMVFATATTPNDPDFGKLWGLNNIGQTSGKVDADVDATEAWDVTKGSATVKVGIIDTGVDYNHPDLAPNIWTNPGETGLDANGHDKATNGIDDDGDGYIDDVHGWNFAGDNNDPMDDFFHGTHVAGTIGAVGNNGKGVSGVCWNVSIVPIKFLDAYGSGTDSDAIDSIYYATKVGVRLTSNSWGGGGYSQAMKDAIDDAGSKGILFIAAAGNDGMNNDISPSYPASFTSGNIISVAATDDKDNLADFSNYGEASVDVGAPGVKIYSTLPTHVTDAMDWYGVPANYGYLDGTSMATPHVSGAAALLWSRSPTLSASQVRYRILTRSDKLNPFINSISSAGRLNAYNLVKPSWTTLPPDIELISTKTSYPSLTDKTIIGISATIKNLGEITGSSPSVELATDSSKISLLVTGPTNIVNLTALKDVKTPVFQFKLGSTVTATDVIPLNFVVRYSTASGAQSKTLAYNLPVKDLAPFDLKPGFPVKALHTGNGSYQAGPAIHTLVGNITDYKYLEIVFSSEVDGPLQVINYGTTDGGSTKLSAMDDYHGTAYPVMGNFTTNASRMYKVFSGYYEDSSTMAIYKGAFQTLAGWPKHASNYIASPATAVDLDGDGIDEIITEEEDWELHAYKADGSVVKGWPVDLGNGQQVYTPAAADLDGDGKPEVVATTETLSGAGGQISVLGAYHANGTPVAGFPINITASGPGLPVIGDVDGDGKKEIILATKGSAYPWDPIIWIISNTGQVKKKVPLTGQELDYFTAPALADLDGDGFPEIIVQTDSALNVVKGNGTSLPGWPKKYTGYWMGNSAPVVGDIDGDGQPEIVITLNIAGSGELGEVRAYRKDGTMHPNFPKKLPIGAGAVPAIADLERDGRNELIVTGDYWNGVDGYYDKVWAFDLKGPKYGKILWGQFGGGPKHQNAYPVPSSAQ